MLSEAVVEIAGNPFTSSFCVTGPFEHATILLAELKLDARDPLILPDILQTRIQKRG